MIDIKNGDNSFVFYDNIKELPIYQFKEFQKATLQESGVGCTMEAIRDKVVKIYTFLNDEKYEFVQQELNNLYNASNFIMNKLSTTSECLVYLINHVNGKKIDFETDNLDNYRQMLESVPIGEIEGVVETVKKNYQPN